MPGLTFAESRSLVLECFQQTIKKYRSKKSSQPSTCCADSESSFRSFYLWNIFFIIVLLCISSIDISTEMYYGIFIPCLIVLLQFILNFFIMTWYNNTSNLEVVMNLQKIYSEYEKSIMNEMKTNPNNTNETIDIKAGHAHISVVSCYRGNKWRRIPTLLLAKGDVIALQCGDITPGLCIELDRQSLVDIFPPTTFSPNSADIPDISLPINSSSPALSPLAYAQQQQSQQQPKSKILEKGTKIFYSSSMSKGSSTNNTFNNNSNKNAAPYSYQRHKSLPADSLELLTLSGDMRCFLMAATPLESFVEGN